MPALPGWWQQRVCRGQILGSLTGEHASQSADRLTVRGDTDLA
jgi:hypothetical protein